MRVWQESKRLRKSLDSGRRYRRARVSMNRLQIVHLVRKIVRNDRQRSLDRIQRSDAARLDTSNRARMTRRKRRACRRRASHVPTDKRRHALAAWREAEHRRAYLTPSEIVRLPSFIDRLSMGRHAPGIQGHAYSGSGFLAVHWVQAHRRYCLGQSACAVSGARRGPSMSRRGGLSGLLFRTVVAYTRKCTFRGLGCSFDATQYCRRPIEASDWRYDGQR